MTAGLARWVEWNGCVPDPEVRSWTTLRVWRFTHRSHGQGRDGTSVEYYEISGGGHTWPGRQPTLDFLGASTTELDANDRLWGIFLATRASVRKQSGADDANETPREARLSAAGSFATEARAAR